MGLERGASLLRHGASLGSPRWNLDDFPRLAVLRVPSLSLWEGSVTIPEQNSEPLPKKVRNKKTLSKALAQYSLDRYSGHPEPEQGKKV